VVADLGTKTKAEAVERRNDGDDGAAVRRMKKNKEGANRHRE